MAVPLAWALSSLPWWQFAIATTLLTLIGVWAAHRSDLSWGTEDSGRIVIDEVVGYLYTMTFVPRDEVIPLVVGFIVFRALDIGKPPPVRWLDQNLPGGWGVVLDDVAAGFMGAAIMVALAHAGAFAWLAGVM